MNMVICSYKWTTIDFTLFFFCLFVFFYVFFSFYFFISLTLMILILWVFRDQLFCRMSLRFCLSDVSSWLGLGYAFWQEYHRINAVFPMSICITSDGVNFDHIAKMVSAKLLHFKVTVLPFVINKYLWGDTLTMQTFCFSSYFCPIIFNIYP